MLGNKDNDVDKLSLAQHIRKAVQGPSKRDMKGDRSDKQVRPRAASFSKLINESLPILSTPPESPDPPCMYSQEEVDKILLNPPVL